MCGVRRGDGGGMDRVVWTGTVLPGKYGEYKERHEQIWPEMREALYNAGVRNYSIWSDGQKLIGYYECENKNETESRKKENPVFQKWSETMKSLMSLDSECGKEGFVKIFLAEEP